jgi:rSAM-associated Gly-rich repeat protein
MSAKKRTSKALALLLPAGVVGISAALAATQSQAEATIHTASNNVSVADRLSEIRAEVSSVNEAVFKSPSGAHLMLADWLNGGFGWRNGGWGNGGWHNGGWGNGGWHNGGWGNGGWHNWGNGGWHNWHNFWHNW